MLLDKLEEPQGLVLEILSGLAVTEVMAEAVGVEEAVAVVLVEILLLAEMAEMEWVVTLFLEELEALLVAV